MTDGPDTTFEMKADLEILSSLAKRRGFAYPSAEIYGGFQSTWDYGPLGVEMKRQIRELWWRWMVQSRDDVVGIEAAVITNPAVWRASGHVDNFTDPLVDCLECRARVRADHIEDNTCPSCGTVGRFTEERSFNLLFRTFVGPVEEDASVAYLRPETAQGMFVNFDNVMTTTRRRLPVGIAQIGKSFRNEITTGNFIFRTREFEQGEMEFFVKPGEDERWFDYWVQARLDWYVSLGIRPESLHIRPHDPDELSHYSKGTSDIEMRFPWGWGELEGIANRTDFDLKRHAESSGAKLEYFDQEQGESYRPYVIEPAMGFDRAALAFLVDAYDEEPGDDVRTVVRFHPDVAPIQVSVLPLSRNDKLVPTAREVYAELRRNFVAQYDDAQSIGRRYRRQDEIGTPLCVTVDFETVEQDQAVTIRNRDTMVQVRVPVADLVSSLRDQLRGMGASRV